VKSRFSGITELRWAEATENSSRADLVISARVRLAKVLKPDAEREAERRKTYGKAMEGEERADPGTNLPHGRAMDIVAAEVGLSRTSLRQATAVYDAAAEDPEQHGDLLEEMDKAKKVYGAYMKLQRQMKAAAAAPDEPKPLEPERCSLRLRTNGEFLYRGNIPQAMLAAKLRAYADLLDARGTSLYTIAQAGSEPMLPAILADRPGSDSAPGTAAPGAQGHDPQFVLPTTAGPLAGRRSRCSDDPNGEGPFGYGRRASWR
jgi:hypothetical protein